MSNVQSKAAFINVVTSNSVASCLSIICILKNKIDTNKECRMDRINELNNIFQLLLSIFFQLLPSIELDELSFDKLSFDELFTYKYRLNRINEKNAFKILPTVFFPVI